MVVVPLKVNVLLSGLNVPEFDKFPTKVMFLLLAFKVLPVEMFRFPLIFKLLAKAQVPWPLKLKL